MNTTAIPVSDHSWSRRCSTETHLSIQDRETDYARDTSDTDLERGSDEEYEPVTEPEDEAPLDDETSAESDDDIIATKVVEVSVADEGELVLADSERTDDSHSDSDVDLDQYERCARCRALNDDPNYRYCHKCFQVRKSFFPPRPRRKHKRAAEADATRFASAEPLPRALSQDSGVETCSQSTSHDDTVRNVELANGKKRRSESLDRDAKRPRYSNGSDSDDEIAPLSKSLSDPSVSIENVVTKKVIVDALKEIETNELCVVCVTEPKSGVFVHGRLAHICCCYKCAVKVWVKTKRCPICKRQISNVLKAVVM